MRVYLAVRHSLDPKFYYGGLWSGNFIPALEQLGCEVVESSVDLLPASRFMHIAGNFTPEERAMRAEITGQILDELRREHARRPIDLFLSYFYNAHFEPSAFADIRKLGIPSVNFYCNSIYQFDWVAEIARAVDFAWHAERDARDAYLRLGARPVWVQMAADPAACRPATVPRREASACFVGQRYADRDRWMAALIAAGIPVAIYGHGWGRNDATQGELPASAEPSEDAYLGRRVIPAGSGRSYANLMVQNLREGGPIRGLARCWAQYRYRVETRRLDGVLAPSARGPAKDVARTFGSHEVVLNFSNVWADGRPGSPLIPHVRLRDFEAPMCRSCYLTGHTDEIAEFYEIGKEIDTYRTREELVDKTRYYLSHADAAEALRDAGYRRALRDHKWTNRFEELFRKIGLGARGANPNSEFRIPKCS